MNYIKSYHLFYLVIAYLIFAVTGDFDFDYGFYQLLRFVAFFAFSFAAYAAYSNKQQIMPFVLGFIAIIFNPFIPIHMDRDIWQIIDLFVALTLLGWVSFTYKTIPYLYLMKLHQKFNRKFYIALGGASAFIFVCVILSSFIVPFREEEPAAEVAAAGFDSANEMLVDEFSEDTSSNETSSSAVLFSSMYYPTPEIKQIEQVDDLDIDYKAKILKSSDGLTIGEVKLINNRKRELGLPTLDTYEPVNPNRPFKSEVINDLIDPQLELQKIKPVDNPTLSKSPEDLEEQQSSEEEAEPELDGVADTAQTEVI